jgi:hypothetical protein
MVSRHDLISFPSFYPPIFVADLSAVSRAANTVQERIINQFLSLEDYKRAISTPSAFYNQKMK